MATLETVRKAVQLIEPTRRARWFLLGGLSILASILEAFGALLIFALLGVITEPNEGISLPLIGDLSATFPAVSPQKLLLYSLILIGAFFVVRALFFLVQVYLQHRVAYNAGVLLSQRLLGNYLRMPYALYLQRNSAELIRNANDSVDVISRFLFVPAVAVIADALLIIGVVAILLFVAPAVTLLATAVLGPIIVILLRAIQPQMEKLGAEGQEMAKESLQWIQQSLQGFRDITLMDRHRFFESQYATRKAALARAYYMQATYVGVPRIALETIFVLFILVFLGVTVLGPGSLVDAISVLGLFSYAVLRIMPAANRMVSSVNMFKFGAAAVDNVYNDLFIDRADPHQPTESINFKESLVVEDLHYTYPDTEDPVLLGIDLQIEKGESIGIVGPTGSGKSTLVDLMLGLLTPTSGSIKVDGVDIATRTAAWQVSLGVVSQSAFLIDDSIRHNIALGLDDSEIDEERLEKAIKVAALDSVIDSLAEGLDTLIGERGVRLSGGQRQRVSIARALYLEPAVLVLDEGTSALDNVTEAQVMEAISSTSEKRTLIAIAHRLSTVERCDRIAVLKGGRIDDVGSFHELLQRSVEFRRLAEAGTP